MRSRYLITILCFAIVASLSLACQVPKAEKTTKSEKPSKEEFIDPSVTYSMISGDIDRYKGKMVRWGGKIFREPERREGWISFQIFLEPDKSEGNTLVAGPEPAEGLKTGDYVIVTGTIKGTFEGENAFGGKIRALEVTAKEIRKVTRAEAIAPTLQTINVGQTNSQNGFNLTLDKIELARTETRVYLTAKDDSGTKVSFHTYNAKLLQGNTQHEAKTLFEEKETQLPSEIMPGVQVQGMLVFPAIDQNIKQLKLMFDKPYAPEQWSLEWSDIAFDVVF